MAAPPPPPIGEGDAVMAGGTETNGCRFAITHARARVKRVWIGLLEARSGNSDLRSSQHKVEKQRDSRGGVEDVGQETKPGFSFNAC
jgi:hypothetical protein